MTPSVSPAPSRSIASPAPQRARPGAGNANPFDRALRDRSSDHADTEEAKDSADTRHEPATPGKMLPDAGPSLDWIATLIAAQPATVPAPPPVAAPTVAADTAGAVVTAAQGGSGAALGATPAGMNPAGAIDTSGLIQTAAFANDPALANATGPIVIEIAPALAQSSATPGKDMAPDAVPAPDPALTPASSGPTPALPTGKAMPAAELFAAAIHAARDDRDGRPVAAGSSDADAGAILSPAGLGAPSAHAVTGAGAAGQSGGSSLDMGQDRWPHAMMDRIERLRDEANAADTRIRLVPDALGAVDINVRREGDTLHVRFHADEAATRGMLTDAQPQLVRIAEERGLKLGQSMVGGGSTGGGTGFGGDDRTPPRPAPVSARPPSAAAPAPDTIDARVG
ncbi:flagellar hook-length control protein FliK [Sphingomonas gellani]|uniref:Flagellar hook-length control protein FliK n=1 Tax=Sphingomonas gellani TaxID=1166340 RepID=A0A1H8CLM7_9SPHN|nr:flagellar hook-length control protein FliK [Sphingomonas gellani]SEM94987.1 flagellar hook-length control protein FliK [Sphingomonas gellani]